MTGGRCRSVTSGRYRSVTSGTNKARTSVTFYIDRDRRSVISIGVPYRETYKVPWYNLYKALYYKTKIGI